MAAGFVPELKIDKQMGCMTGILQIFDRHQILAGKSTKRLLPPLVVDTISETEVSAEASPVHARGSGKPKQLVLPSPEQLKKWLPPAELLPLTLPTSESKEGVKGTASWKLSKETPRLSLDSRATTDEKGGVYPLEIRSSAAVQPLSNGVAFGTQVCRSHTLIAKLMGLEPMPNSLHTPESEKKPELRRSSSESGVSRGSLDSRFIMNLPVKQQYQSHTPIVTHEVKSNVAMKNSWNNDDNGVNLSPWKAPQHGKSFFDSADYFPEPKRNVSAQGEIEKRLKPNKDLETLKNIFESLQLKGLLHSSKPAERNHLTHHQKFVYDESPIVVMKPSRSSITSPIHRRTENVYLPVNGRSPERQIRRNYSVPVENSPTLIVPVENSPALIPQHARRPNSLVKPKPLSIETQRRANELTDNRRVLPALPRKLHTRITGSEPTTHVRPPRSKKGTYKDYQKVNYSGEDESASISGSSSSTSTETERSRTDGKNLLERCDKLLPNIAEMTAAADMQPSPVSVLDSSLYRDESFTASPMVAKRKIHFKDHYGNTEEETGSIGVSPISQETSEPDFLYIVDIVSASNLFPGELDLFLFLEKQQFQRGQDSSKASKLHRKAIFDTITEILKWIRRLPPWKNVSWTTDDVTNPSLGKVWLEFQRIRDRGNAEDMYDIVCGVLKKDFSGDDITGWKDYPTEMSETILDLERLVFKDLIGETLRDLAALTSENRLSRMIRKKVLWK